MATTFKSLLLSVLLVSSNALAQTYTDDATFGNFHLLEQSSTPATPTTGYSLYPKSDGKLYLLNSSGVETPVGNTTSSVYLTDSYLSAWWGIAAPSLVFNSGALASGGLVASTEAPNDTTDTPTIEVMSGAQMSATGTSKTGDVELRSGDNSGSGAVGTVYLSAGASSQGQGGAVTISSGNGATVSGDISLSSGTGNLVATGKHFIFGGDDLVLPFRTTDPTPYGTGSSYWNSSSNIFKIYDGTTWHSLIDSATLNSNLATREPTIAAGTATQVWHGNKTWSKVDLSTDVTSTLSVGNGGTGQTTANGALNALLPSQSSKSGKFLSTDGTNALWADGGGSGSGGINLLANQDPEFSSGVSGWSSTGTTPSYVTSGTGIGIFDSKGYMTWDSTAAGEEICLPQVSVNSLASNNGQLLVYSRVPSGTATHEFRIYDGAGNLLKSLPITSTTTPYPNSTNLPFPTTGNTLEFCVHAIAANEPSIDIDHIYLGQTTNITSVENISDWTDFPSVAAGTLITATTTPPSYGTVATNKARWRRVGTNMEIEWDFRQSSAGTNGSGAYLFNLPPGYIIDTTAKPANTASTVSGFADGAVGTAFLNYAGTGTTVGGIAVYSSTQLKVADVHVAGSSASNGVWGTLTGVGFGNTPLDIHFRASVPIQGWSTNQSAAAANQTDYGRTSYTPTFTGFGTVPPASIDCYHSRTNEFLHLDCKFTAGATSATEARVSLPNGLVPNIASIRGVGQVTIGGAGAAEYIVLAEPSNSYVTFSFQNSAQAGLTKQNGSAFISTGVTMSFTADIPIVGWTPNNKAPTLIGSITTSNPTQADRVEYAKITNSGTATISTNGTCFSSVTRNTTGDLTVAIASGCYSSAPRCFITCEKSTGCSINRINNTITTTSVPNINTFNASGSAVDADFNLMCAGAR